MHVQLGSLGPKASEVGRFGLQVNFKLLSWFLSLSCSATSVCLVRLLMFWNCVTLTQRVEEPILSLELSPYSRRETRVLGKAKEPAHGVVGEVISVVSMHRFLV